MMPLPANDSALILGVLYGVLGSVIIFLVTLLLKPHSNDGDDNGD